MDSSTILNQLFSTIQVFNWLIDYEIEISSSTDFFLQLCGARFPDFFLDRFLPGPPQVVVMSPCAACKILRRRCTVDKCALASYFPPILILPSLPLLIEFLVLATLKLKMNNIEKLNLIISINNM
ncbi:DUF260 family protein [Medicago truncatula]|uniref:DUF260 family protein n=1 Tax=Medicago truncatula TaxID=3880 RepID=A0A072UBV4_MEDTR|nr:DUF260 family protein [Medicago truncatula]